jgi:phosphoglycolate phosphatase
MSEALRLVVFDVDGTLVDSQADIVAAMGAAYAAVGATPPSRETVLSVVGLSLDVLFPHLCPDFAPEQHRAMAHAYKTAYQDLRAKVGVAESSPLYPGAEAALRQLNDIPHVLLGVATGKSKRGLDKLIEGHRLHDLFITRQVADFHPSKPHPSMLLQAMQDAGVEPHQAVMIGDTTFDMDMAAAAGMGFIGVDWGYHPREKLRSAQRVIEHFDELVPALDAYWSVSA